MTAFECLVLGYLAYLCAVGGSFGKTSWAVAFFAVGSIMWFMAGAVKTWTG
jgi:hypothetical protein|tara:strand:+ start:6608 stop:6760 length:153 start_codon:yes stop_codon:yes gene_type:complete